MNRPLCGVHTNKGLGMITIGIPVYDKVDLLDVMGPHEMLKWMQPAADVRLLAQTPGQITSRDGLTFIAPNALANAPQFDVIWVPGGDPSMLTKLMSGPDRTYLDFLIQQSHAARYVCSVCEGAMLLAAAGLLNGYKATTHWAFIPCLRKFPGINVVDGTPRFVHDRDRLTGGGISAGLDESLKLIELLAGYEAAQGVQQSTQYYPDPPVQSSLPMGLPCPFSW